MLTCQHANDRQEDLLHTLHGTPPLRAALVSHGIIPRSMKDRDADSPIWVNCTKSTEEWLLLSGNAQHLQISLEHRPALRLVFSMTKTKPGFKFPL